MELKVMCMCIERKYKVQSDKIVYIVTAKRELSEDLTGKLLHEDMELKTFLANYEIESISETPKEEIIKIPRREEMVEQVIEKEITEKETIEKERKERPVSAKLPTEIQREWIIMQAMPEEFALNDIIKFYEEKDEKYDISELKLRYSYTIQSLKKRGKIKVVNPEANRRSRRYYKLKDDIDKMIKNLKDGQKVLLETMR